MPLKSARPLPRRYNRPTSPQTRKLANKRRERKKKMRREQWRRNIRRWQRTWAEWRTSLLRWLLIALALTLVAVCIGLLFSPLVRVQEISVVRGNPRIDIEQVQRTLSPFFGRHFLFLTDSEVATLLEREFPDIDSVDVRKMYPSELHVEITLEEVTARLDIVEPGQAASDEQSGTGAFLDFLTDGGTYVQTAAPESGAPLPLIRLVDWGARPVPGSHLLSAEWFDWMNGAEQALAQEFGHGIITRTLYLRAQELHIDIGPYELWLDLRSPLQDQLLRYRTFLQSVGAGAVTEYVDLRLAGRVVYK